MGRSEILDGDLTHYDGDRFAAFWPDSSLKADAFVDFTIENGRVTGMKMQAISDLTDFSYDFHDHDLKRLTAQPSISAQRLGVKECGEMVVAELQKAGFTAEPMDNVNLATAFGYYDYRNVTSTAEANSIPFSSGQSVTSTTLEDLNLLNLASELKLKAGDYPVKLWGDWVHNTAAKDEENGYQVGIKLGKAKKPWSLKDGWEAGWF